MSSMSIFNHWRGEDKIPVFAPRTVADVKSGKQKKHKLIAAAGSSSSCASCGSGCSGGGCSGPGV